MASQGSGLLHAEYDELSSLAGYGVRQAGIVGTLTNAQVVAAATAEELVAILDTVPGTVHAEYEFSALNSQRSLQRGDAIGDFSDTRVAASTSVENLAEKTNAADENDLGHLGPFIV